jgi:hypothetical protein
MLVKSETWKDSMSLPKKAPRLHYELMLAYVIIGWSILCLFIVMAMYLYISGNQMLDHSMYVFHGKVALWQPASNHAGIEPPPSDFPEMYVENTARYLGDAMSRYMEWYCNNTMEYQPRRGTSLLRAIYTEKGKELSCIVIDIPGSNAVAVLFKGTTSHYQWSIDFTYQTASPDSMMRTGANTTSKQRVQRAPQWNRMTSDNPKQVLIHQGFAQFYNCMRSQIHHAIKTSSRRNVLICGHSLGGGIANVCLFDIIDSKLRVPERVYCVTIASPRVGNPAFAQFLESRHTRLFQLRNTADVVPLVPLTWTPSLKGEKELFEYEHAGVAMLFENRSNNLRGAHMLEAYQTHMLRNQLTAYSE